MHRQKRAKLGIPIPDGGPVFSIPGFGIGEFLIPGSRRDYGIPEVLYQKPLFLNTWAYVAKCAFFCHSVTGLFI